MSRLRHHRKGISSAEKAKIPVAAPGSEAVGRGWAEEQDDSGSFPGVSVSTHDFHRGRGELVLWLAILNFLYYILQNLKN